MFPDVMTANYIVERGCPVYGFRSIRDNLNDLKYHLIRKFVLSLSPTSSLNCIVMASHGPETQFAFCRPRDIAFCRPRDNGWTVVKTLIECFDGFHYYSDYLDIVYYDTRFFTLNSSENCNWQPWFFTDGD